MEIQRAREDFEMIRERPKRIPESLLFQACSLPQGKGIPMQTSLMALEMGPKTDVRAEMAVQGFSLEEIGGV